MRDLSIPLRLCAFARVKKKKLLARKDAKPQRVLRGRGQELQQLDTRNPPRRAGLPSVGRQEPISERLVRDLSIPLRLCAFARVNPPNPLVKGELPHLRIGVDHNFFAALRLCKNKKKESTAADGVGAQSREGAKKGELFLCDSAPCPPRWAFARVKNLRRRIGFFCVYTILKSGSCLFYSLFFAKSKMAPIPTPMDNPNPAPKATPVEMSPNTIPKAEPKTNPKQAPRAIPFPEFLFFFSSICFVKPLIL